MGKDIEWENASGTVPQGVCLPHPCMDKKWNSPLYAKHGGKFKKELFNLLLNINLIN